MRETDKIIKVWDCAAKCELQINSRGGELASELYGFLRFWIWDFGVLDSWICGSLDFYNSGFVCLGISAFLDIGIRGFLGFQGDSGFLGIGNSGFLVLPGF